ncbi:MAG: hypothetical protein QQN41_13680 [Nitrosopumilus sp.]|nr:hypothetical protein [Candidatus Neomarinimicrobiota bacterium]
MEAIKKITTVKNNSISFNELKKLNNQEVEVIIIPLVFEASFLKKKQNENFLKFSGTVETDFTDTSLKVDELIYGI